ncbi:FAD binding domain-containing protein (plasmid) [Methylobacterium sp. NMS12]|uniref:FAD binding domain-containing protein n=1 Tax=Methylobacterium sp. NMS12 TaxID=3079766 RepID=UPI003F885B57
MKAAAFDYARPLDLAAAIRALTGDGARPLGGGQSLGPMLNLRLARPDKLVGLSHLDALRGIADRGTSWHIGAGVTHARLEDEPLSGLSMLAEVASDIAYRSIRSRGTIGGSLVHADPAADWPLTLAALGAGITVVGPAGTRMVAVTEFLRGAFTVDLASDEVVTAITVPKVSPGALWSYLKFCRKKGDFAQASAAILLDPTRRIARVFAGALNGPPASLPDLAESLAAGTRPDAAALEAAIASAAPELDHLDRRMHAAALRRAIEGLRPAS